MSELIPGMPIGDYAVVHLLARGGMGEVYLGRATHRDAEFSQVVIKRLRPEFANDPEYRNMLLDEAKIVSALRHPNLARFVALEEVAGEYLLLLEYFEGQTLADLMRATRRAMPLGVVLAIGQQVASGLEYAHGRRDAAGGPMEIVHRDISLSNIVVSRSGMVQLIDFGVARARHRRSKSQAGILKGKHRYMAPEQLQGKSVDHRADIYALGVTLCELAMGKRLLGNAGTLTGSQRLRLVGMSPVEVAPVTKEFKALVKKALAFDPAGRYQSAAEFGDRIRDLAERFAMDIGDTAIASFMGGESRLPLPLSPKAIRSRRPRHTSTPGVGVSAPLGSVSLRKRNTSPVDQFSPSTQELNGFVEDAFGGETTTSVFF